MPVRGIAIEGASQLVFIDTPGIFAPRRRLDRAMVDAAWGGAGDADVVALLVDAARGLDEEVERILAKLKDTQHAAGAGAQQDRPRPEGAAARRWPPTATSALPFEDTFMISALSGDGVADLKAPSRPLASSRARGITRPTRSTDAPLRLLASEITREKIFDRLHDELPYEIDGRDHLLAGAARTVVRIEQTIFVERDSQKAIVLGKGGQTIQQLSMESRKELTEIVERPVHLFLFVKVRENWADDPERYRELGLDFPKD